MTEPGGDELSVVKPVSRARRRPLLTPTNLRIVAAIGLGVIWAMIFPTANLGSLAWLVPGCLLLLTSGWSGTSAFRFGYLVGLVYYLASLRWLLHIPFPAGAVAGWFALSAYLALYPALWAWLCQRTLRWLTAPERGNRAETPGSDTGFWSAEFERLQTADWSQRACWTFLAAVFWVAWEMAVGRALTGFPWNFLGVSQHQMIPLIQIASITGVYGVSFVVAWFSVGLTLTILRLARGRRHRWVWATELGLPLATLLLLVAWGFLRLTSTPAPDRQLAVALVQPSIPQELIWDHRQDAHRFDQVLQLSRLALAVQPTLLVWPEAAMPSLTETNYHAITNLIAEHRVWMIFGADDAERRVTAAGEATYDFYNCAILLDPTGHYAASYRKQQLVIFGEYVPLQRWLPFLKFLTPIEGSFRPGRGPVPFSLKDPDAKLSVLICFEDVFPHLVRRHVDEDTDFLLNLTNNGWFGESAAQWQHAASAAFRAVENGLPLVRCTNNGLTCWYDAAGRLRQFFGQDGSSVYGPGFMTASVPLLPEGGRRAPTFYRQHGDWFGWACMGLTLGGLWLTRPARRNAPIQSPRRQPLAADPRSSS